VSHQRGDVVLVPLDFSNLAGTKVRPAVVVSSDQYNQGPDRLLCSITSNLQALPHPGDHAIADWQGAGLRAPSLMQMKVFVIEQSLIGRTIGHLQPTDLDALNHGLAEALGLQLAAAER
jgi:mRNA interferase MazF